MHPPTIVCVDDEFFLLNSLVETLKCRLGRDFMIEMAETAQLALEIFEDLQANGVEIPLIISDQIMPDMKGVDLLIEVYSRSPQTLQILLTGRASVEDIGKAVNSANLYRYISKPWEEEDLILTVKEAIRRFEQEKKLAQQHQKLQQLNTDLEQKVIERTAELVKAQKAAEMASQAKVNFLSLISHELRTPLNSILGYSQLLGTDLSLSEDHQKNIQFIHHSGNQLLTLINDMIAVSRLEAGLMSLNERSFDLPSLLNFVQDVMTTKAKYQGLKLEFKLDSRLPNIVYGDDIKLRHILISLLGKMIHLTESGWIILSAIPGKPIPLKIKSLFGKETEQLWLKFELEQTQGKLNKTDANSVLNSFKNYTYHLDPDTERGLSISSEFIRLMGGETVTQTQRNERLILAFEIGIRLSPRQETWGMEHPSNQNSQSDLSLDIQPPGSNHLSVDSLTVMPKSWLEQLHKGAAQCSDHYLRPLIEQIPPEHSDLAQGLQDLVEDFRFDVILDLVHPYL